MFSFHILARMASSGCRPPLLLLLSYSAQARLVAEDTGKDDEMGMQVGCLGQRQNWEEMTQEGQSELLLGRDTKLRCHYLS